MEKFCSFVKFVLTKYLGTSSDKFPLYLRVDDYTTTVIVIYDLLLQYMLGEVHS